MITDTNTHPEKNIYFIGAQIIKIAISRKKKLFDIYALFEEYNKSATTKISFDYLLLGIDWLYLLEAVSLDEDGNIKLCF